MAEKITSNLKQLMQDRGLTAEALSKMSGLNARTIRDIANNKYDRIGINSVLGPLCKALNCKPGDILVIND